MPVDVTTEIVIDRSIDEVAAFAADPDKAPLWYANIKSVEWLTPPPAQAGSRIRFVAEFFGRSLAYVYEVIDYTPGRRMVMRTAEGPFPMETTYEWAPAIEAATRMTLRNRGEPRGFGAIASPLMALAIKQANAVDLAKLRGLLEPPTSD